MAILAASKNVDVVILIDEAEVIFAVLEGRIGGSSLAIIPAGGHLRFAGPGHRDAIGHVFLRRACPRDRVAVRAVCPAAASARARSPPPPGGSALRKPHIALAAIPLIASFEL